MIILQRYRTVCKIFLGSTENLLDKGLFRYFSLIYLNSIPFCLQNIFLIRASFLLHRKIFNYVDLINILAIRNTLSKRMTHGLYHNVHLDIVLRFLPRIHLCIFKSAFTILVNCSIIGLVIQIIFVCINRLINYLCLVASILVRIASILVGNGYLLTLKVFKQLHLRFHVPSKMLYYKLI